MSTKKSQGEWADAYKDSRWQKKRLEIMERDGWKCRSCGSGKDDGITLNVHHQHYVKGHKPWEYKDEELVTLCEDCHSEITRAREEIFVLIGHLTHIPSLQGISFILPTLVSNSNAMAEVYGHSPGLLKIAAEYFVNQLDLLDAAHMVGWHDGREAKMREAK
jgi:hypothetical protein